MIISQKVNVLRKLVNDSDRSIDYYENVCRDDGGTNLVLSFPVVTGTAQENDFIQQNFEIRRVGKLIFDYEDLYDLFEYESRLATEELTAVPAIMQQIKIGEQEIKEGKKIRWRDVYREV